MRLITAVLMFYKKLLLPSILMSVFMGLISMVTSDTFSTHTVGAAYILFALFFHFTIYEIRNPNEYYFYYNLGLSKMVLWMSTVLISFCIGLIIRVL